MIKIYKFNIQERILYMMEGESKRIYNLTDEYVPIVGDVIMEDFTTKNEFTLNDAMEYQKFALIQSILLSANGSLKNGIDDIDISYEEALYYSGVSYINVTIKWGDVEISNSNGQRHPLLGIYTQIKFHYYNKSGNIKMYDFKIFRDRFTSLEKTANYKHSHVNRSYPLVGFAPVCLGNSELYTLFLHKRYQVKTFDFDRLFMYVESFIQWESLEGGPYFTLSALYRGAAEKSSVTLSSDTIIEIVESMDIEVLLTIDEINIPENTIAEAVIDNPNIPRVLPKYQVPKKHKWWSEHQINETYETAVTFRGKRVRGTVIPNTEVDDVFAETIFCTYSPDLVKLLSRKFTDILTDNPWKIIEDDPEEHVDLSAISAFIQNIEIQTIINDMENRNETLEELESLIQ